jgi:hypothetical protein
MVEQADAATVRPRISVNWRKWTEDLVMRSVPGQKALPDGA